MKTSSRNISKLRVSLQIMYSAEQLRMATSGIVIISTILNGCSETSLKIDSTRNQNFRSSHWTQFLKIRIPEIIKKHER